MFQIREIRLLKGATIKEKNIFVPLRVAPKRIENNFKGRYIEKAPNSSHRARWVKIQREINRK